MLYPCLSLLKSLLGYLIEQWWGLDPPSHIIGLGQCVSRLPDSGPRASLYRNMDMCLSILNCMSFLQMDRCDHKLCLYVKPRQLQ